LSIALFMPPLEKLRDRWLAVDPMLAPEVIPKWQQLLRAAARVVLTSFVTSLAAWLGALPLTAYYFHIFSPVTLLANLVIVPMSSLALACNLGSLLCGDWLPWLTELFNHCAWFWMLAMVKVSHWSTEIPGAYSFVTAPSAFTFIIYYGLLIGFMSGWLWRPERRPRTLAALALIGIFLRRPMVRHAQEHRTHHPAARRRPRGILQRRRQIEDWLMDCGNTNSVELSSRAPSSARKASIISPPHAHARRPQTRRRRGRTRRGVPLPRHLRQLVPLPLRRVSPHFRRPATRALPHHPNPSR
jgi:hypothetical protein